MTRLVVGERVLGGDFVGRCWVKKRDGFLSLMLSLVHEWDSFIKRDLMVN